MLVIKFGSWGIMCDGKFKYARVGYIHIPYLFGGFSIPIPLCRKVPANSMELVNTAYNKQRLK